MKGSVLPETLSPGRHGADATQNTTSKMQKYTSSLSGGAEFYKFYEFHTSLDQMFPQTSSRNGAKELKTKRNVPASRCTMKLILQQLDDNTNPNLTLI